ncbi:kinesin-like protein KIN-14L [Primulina huaijiensis]|uniref:kinesin-like protein KIN-14L n=1 Tax=Primulina huaijiensis TaxID=1492673 RepID=UPI003CC7470F
MYSSRSYRKNLSSFTLMEDLTRTQRVDVLNFGSRKDEEAALRRYQATHWLDCLVGPLGIPDQPSEKEFISCLRNGLILCNIINKIQPGSVPKIIEAHYSSQSLPWDSQPLPAYQYFENIRNFIVTLQELKLPVFEASIFERDNLEKSSSTKVVDCILALKDYHEWKQMTGGNGFYKPPRSPLVMHSTGMHVRSPGMFTYESSRRLDMLEGNHKSMPTENEMKNLEDKIMKAFVERMVDTKENMDNNQLACFHVGNAKSVKLFGKILWSCLDEQLQRTFPKFKSALLDHLREISLSLEHSTVVPRANLSNLEKRKCCRACLKKGNCNHWNLVKQQEKKLLNVKLLLANAKQEFQSLQSQLQNDLKQFGDHVLEMTADALAYHKVVKENRNLYNMVQDLKGNIRVYCRIRPVLNPEVPNIIDFVGRDGSLVVVDPMKPHEDGMRTFQFNRVFGPTSTQDEVYRDIQPLITSVMDGYNVCILAYGQTGSGKTYTMCGSSGGSTMESGISYSALNDLFELSDQRKDITKYEIQVQMVEIYNEQVHDLLVEHSSTTKYPLADKILTLDIQSCVTKNGLALPSASLHVVKSFNDVINLMKLSTVGSTVINIRSSRSHSVLTIHVHGKDISGTTLSSCLQLVDLAGSERDRSEVAGYPLEETQYINKSLSCLGDVITALAQKNSYIPYRNSKLTLLLQSSLGGNAKTLMFAHVSPEGDSFEETMSTLKFTQRISTVELGAARANKESSEVLDLKLQIENLRKALANKELRTPRSTKPKEAVRSPLPKQMVERTPPCTRRLSIEGPRNTQKKDPHEIRSPRLISKPTTPDVTCSQYYSHVEDGKSMKPRSRRLSLEGPRNAKKDLDQMKSPKAALSKPTTPTCSQNYSQLEDEKLVAKSPKQKRVNGSLLGLSPRRAPMSPNSSLRSQVLRIDTANVQPSFQLPKTPEPHTSSRNEAHGVIQNDHILLSPCSIRNARGKGSQIKQSLRSIRKLINGSEKRNQPKQTEVTSPLNTTRLKPDAKSPVPSSARVITRQSLTSIQPPERSRRTSLGGVSVNSYGNESRNAKTPPPQIRASEKLTKRWL